MSQSAVATQESSNDPDYVVFERQIAARVSAHIGPLFTTAVSPDELWGQYLAGLSDGRRQHYNCHACRRFIQKYGGLVVMGSPSDSPRSLLWDIENVPDLFRVSIGGLKYMVESRNVDGVFLDKEAIWGQPKTKEWTHLSAVNPCPYRGVALTAGQTMAEKHEERGMLIRGLIEYPHTVAEQALRLLKGGVLYRSEKAEGIAEWFVKAHEVHRGERTSGPWFMVTTAPAGFCHIKTTMISTLMDDIKAGMDFEAISQRWNKKMNPTQYQRPQAPPSEGTIDQAEKLVEKLGVARSLERRYATLADVTSKLWVPRPIEAPQAGGVFGHLRTPEPGVKNIELPAVKMTWEKFAREIMPNAKRMEARLVSPGGYYGLTAPVHADAPNIFQWDNAVAWYFPNPSATAPVWNLGYGEWAEVTAVFLSPPHWSDPKDHPNHARQALFALRGAKDTRKDRGMALFKECLRSEFHRIRAVVEAHSERGTIQGKDAGDANGVAFSGNSRPLTIRVDGSASYALDRWD